MKSRNFFGYTNTFIYQLDKEILNSHINRMSQLEVENSKLRESLLENSKAMTSRHQEEIQRMQEALKNLQAQLDKALHDKANLYSEKCHETKRCDNLRNEFASLKSSISTLKGQNEKLVSDMAALKNIERKNDMHMMDSRKHIHELQDKVKKFEKMKVFLGRNYVTR